MRRRDFTTLALTGAVGTAATSAVVKAQTTVDSNTTDLARMVKRIALEQSCGVVLDVQGGFYSRLDGSRRPKIRMNTKNFVRLLGYFRVPIVVTLERPIDVKGRLPQEISEHLGDLSKTFEKHFFDLTRERQITDHLAQLKKKQLIIVGCETDVCVLQSCLGLLRLGYEVYVVEDLVFSLSPNVEAAIARMKAEGAIFLTYKSLFHEAIQAVDGGPHFESLLEMFGPFPRDLPDSAV